VSIGPITRAKTKKLKKALNGLVQNIWSNMDLEGLGTFEEHEGQLPNRVEQGLMCLAPY